MSNVTPLSGPSAPPAAGGSPRSMVIFLHGYGSNGDDLIGLAPYWQAALPHTVFLAPNAPQPCPGAANGYQWWDLADRSGPARAAGVRESAPALNAYIDAQLARHGLTDDKLALVGFSQGTMMALHVGPRRLSALAGIVGYSGMLTDADALTAEHRTKPPVLLVHGDSDTVVPTAASHQAHQALTALGFEASIHISPQLDHSIDMPGLKMGERFLARVLASV